MDLEKFNVVELNVQEMKTIEGGSFIGKIWNWIKGHFVASPVETPKGPGATAGVQVTF